MLTLASEAARIGETLPYWTVLPFVGMLLAIAVLPLATPVWFEHLHNKAIVAAIFGVPVLAYLWATFGGDGFEQILSTGEEYISFIVYIAALFTIAGGIYIAGDTVGSPKNNLAFLIVGSLLANFVGTTGAAMLMIRPLLRANSGRTHKKHIFVFLIFIVCNTAGLLTPLGDPPLFLGFLRGIDFTWTLRLWPQWLITQIILLIVFFVLDSYYFKKESASAKKLDKANPEKIRIQGGINFLFLAGVIAMTMISGTYGVDKGGPVQWWMRDGVYVLLVLCSLFLSPRAPRQRNQFSWAPIGEVAIVFAGIFASMIPALAILKERGDQFGIDQPWQFFWLSGGLSSFLDNAPTYLVFTSLAQGLLGLENFPDLMGTTVNPTYGFAPAAYLAAVSCGAVFMGANSYIGNAPNFMVRSIAEEQGIKMPNFFAYIGWAAIFLIPIFILNTFIFFL
ncbi:MAG: sodium:proton antiporter [Thermoleophilia bacterium]